MKIRRFRQNYSVITKECLTRIQQVKLTLNFLKRTSIVISEDSLCARGLDY